MSSSTRPVYKGIDQQQYKSCGIKISSRIDGGTTRSRVEWVFVGLAALSQSDHDILETWGTTAALMFEGAPGMRAARTAILALPDVPGVNNATGLPQARRPLIHIVMSAEGHLHPVYKMEDARVFTSLLSAENAALFSTEVQSCVGNGLKRFGDVFLTSMRDIPRDAHDVSWSFSNLFSIAVFPSEKLRKKVAAMTTKAYVESHSVARDRTVALLNAMFIAHHACLSPFSAMAAVACDMIDVERINRGFAARAKSGPLNEPGKIAVPFFDPIDQRIKWANKAYDTFSYRLPPGRTAFQARDEIIDFVVVADELTTEG